MPCSCRWKRSPRPKFLANGIWRRVSATASTAAACSMAACFSARASASSPPCVAELGECRRAQQQLIGRHGTQRKATPRQRVGTCAAEAEAGGELAMRFGTGADVVEGGVDLL